MELISRLKPKHRFQNFKSQSNFEYYQRRTFLCFSGFSLDVLVAIKLLDTRHASNYSALATLISLSESSVKGGAYITWICAQKPSH